MSHLGPGDYANETVEQEVTTSSEDQLPHELHNAEGNLSRGTAWWSAADSLVTLHQRNSNISAHESHKVRSHDPRGARR